MNIGKKIRELRKQRGITQEQLANSLGISFQAISKWENNIALPDTTMIPLLASYFGISLDELFDFSLKQVEAEIANIVDCAYKYRERDPQKARTILEKGLKKYPDNDILLNNLLYVMNYTENPDETLRIASGLIERTTEADIRYDALRFLAYAYKAKGDLKSAEAAIEQIPEIYFTKLTEVAFLLEGKPKFDAAEKQKHISFENLLQMMEKIAEYYESEGKTAEAAEERKKQSPSSRSSIINVTIRTQTILRKSSQTNTDILPCFTRGFLFVQSNLRLISVSEKYSFEPLKIGPIYANSYVFFAHPLSHKTSALRYTFFAFVLFCNEICTSKSV